MKKKIVVLTGAGISAESGIKTFRDSDGLWENHRIEDVATPEGFARDPAAVQEFYNARRDSLVRGNIRPNAAHAALARLEAEWPADVLIVTQNIDNLHASAGSRNLIHMHGELAVLRCEQCGHKVRDLKNTNPGQFLPCSNCSHSRLRPDIVWFGEVPFHLNAIENALSDCTHFLAIGTSGQVWPAAGMLQTARDKGAATFVQALELPANADVRDNFVDGRAAEVVPELLNQIITNG